MRKNLPAFAAAGLLVPAVLTGCDGPDAATGGGPAAIVGEARVGVILPDTRSSQRWNLADPKYFRAAFDRAGVKAEIRNANGDPGTFQRIGAEMIASGVRVLIITSLDPDSGGAVLAKARAAKIPTIDYDRLTLNGGADYHVSFNNVEVGELQGKGLRKCLDRKGVRNPVVAQLNGSPTDNNATLFKQGYDSVLLPMYDRAAYTKGPEQWVPGWDAPEAERIFQQMIEQQPRIAGVVAANDGIGNAVIEVLRRTGRAGDVPVTGQDATLDGLRNLLTGEQCVTVYKRIKPEAETAATVAVQLFRGTRPPARAQIKDPESGAYIPFFPLRPQAVDVTGVKDVVADGFVTKGQLCTAKFDDLCKRYGVGEPAAKE